MKWNASNLFYVKVSSFSVWLDCKIRSLICFFKFYAKQACDSIQSMILFWDWWLRINWISKFYYNFKNEKFQIDRCFTVWMSRAMKDVDVGFCPNLIQQTLFSEICRFFQIIFGRKPNISRELYNYKKPNELEFCQI